MLIEFIDYVDKLFANATVSKRTQELKEEIIANLEEKYNDFIEKGYDEERAYEAAIIGLGDIHLLLDDMKGRHIRAEGVKKPTARPEKDLNVPLITTLGIGCIFAAVICFLASGSWGYRFWDYRFWSHESFFFASLLLGVGIWLIIGANAPYDKKRSFRLGFSVFLYLLTAAAVAAVISNRYDYLELLTVAGVLAAAATVIIILDFAPFERGKRRVVAAAVGMYCLAGFILLMPVFSYSYYDPGNIVVPLIICSAATCILIYNFGFSSYHAARGSYISGGSAVAKEKKSETETDYRGNGRISDEELSGELSGEGETKAGRGTEEKAALSRSAAEFESGYWTLVTGLYLFISFVTGSWGISWIIFIFAAAIRSFVYYGYYRRKGK